MERLREKFPMRWVLPFLLLLLTAGCIPCSANPLSTPGEGGTVTGLFGTWHHAEEDETVFLHIGTGERGRGLKVLLIETRKDGKLEMTEFSGHVTKAGEFRYLNLKWVKPDEGCTGWLFVKYALGENTLGTCVVSLDAVEKAIESGELRGSISKSAAMLEDEPGKMMTYFAAHDRELFPEMQSLRRLQGTGCGQEKTSARRAPDSGWKTAGMAPGTM